MPLPGPAVANGGWGAAGGSGSCSLSGDKENLAGRSGKDARHPRSCSRSSWRGENHVVCFYEVLA